MDQKPFTLRAADQSDAEALTALHRECFPNYWNVDAFNDFFAVPGTFALLAEADGPVGMIIYRVQYEQADIITLTVSPPWRKKGVARALVEEALDHLDELGAPRIFLDVEDGNADALALYEGHGFIHVHRRKNYYRQKDGTFTDALVMERKLD